jgi:hypothetical protein
MPEATPPTGPETPPPAEESATTPASPVSGELTLGDLAQRVNAAWPAVTSYRVTFTGATVPGPAAAGTPAARAVATPGATPLARPREAFVSVREVDLPDRQHQAVTGLGGDDHEAIAIGDELFVRGSVVEQIAPGTLPDDWIEIDPSSLPEGAALSHLLGGLPALPGAPLASLPERLWPQAVRDLGTVDFDGRECRVYGAADTVAATGMRVDYTIALDAQDIPCFIETGAGGVIQGRDEYSDIGATFTIEAPSAATPVSIPPELATPIAHD